MVMTSPAKSSMKCSWPLPQYLIFPCRGNTAHDRPVRNRRLLFFLLMVSQKNGFLQCPFRQEYIYASEICEYPEQPVNQCKKDRQYRTTGMPFERYGTNPLHGHDSNRGSKQEREQRKDPQIHNQGFSEDLKIRNILEHSSRLDRDSALHRGVDRAGIIIGACTEETLAERLARTQEIG